MEIISFMAGVLIGVAILAFVLDRFLLYLGKRIKREKRK